MTQTLPFVRKVLRPRKPTNFLSRQRLLDRLHEASLGHSTLLVAGAGFGKTSLLLDYAEDAAVPMCWLSFDESDSDPKTFLMYLLAAIRQVFPNFGMQSGNGLEGASSMGELEHALGLMLSEIYESIPQMFFLALDDVQRLRHTSSVIPLLDRLVLNLPGNCHLIISARNRPGLPSLPRLVAQNEVTIVEADELRFTREETLELLQLRLPDRDTTNEGEKLHQLCDGWVTGILLGASQLLRGQKLDAHEGSALFEYYAAEVFANLTPKEQGVLLSVSVLDELGAELCDVVSGERNALRILRRLSRQDEFSPFFADSKHPRLSQLFQEFLRAKLLEEPERADQVFSAAGRALEERGHWEKVLALYLDGHVWRDAVKVLEQVGLELVDSGKHELVAAYLDQIPVEFSRTPRLAVIRAAVAVGREVPDLALQWISPILEPGSGLLDSEVVGDALKFRASAWRLKGRLQQALEDDLAALSLAQATGKTSAIAKVHHHLGATYARMGNFPSAIAEFKSALRLQEDSGNSHQVALLNQLLGTALEEVGSLSEAVFHYERAASFWKARGQLFSLASVLNNLALVYQLRGQYRLAQDLFVEAFQASVKSGNVRTEAVISLSLADLCSEIANLPDAEELYQRGLALARRLQRPDLEVYALDGLAQTAFLLGRASQAQYYLDDAKTALRAIEEDKHAVGLHWMTEGRHRLATNDGDAAKNALFEARALFEQCDAKEKLARTELLLAETLWRLAEEGEAKAHLSQAFSTAEQLGTMVFLRSTLMECSQLCGQAPFLEGLRSEMRELLRENPATDDIPPLDLKDLSREDRPELPSLKCYGFGSGQVYKDGRLVAERRWDSHKAKELFFYLLVQGESGVSREVAAANLWPDASPAKAKSAFHSTTYRIRRALHDQVVIGRDHRYLVNPACPCWFDVAEFERLVGNGRGLPTESPSRAQWSRRAARLYKGPFLLDSYSDWCEELRQRLEAKYLAVLLSIADFALQQGDLETTTDMCERYLRTDPYDEVPYLLLMKAAVTSEDRTTAMEWYRRYRGVIVGELNAPSAALEEYYHAIISS